MERLIQIESLTTRVDYFINSKLNAFLFDHNGIGNLSAFHPLLTTQSSLISQGSKC